MPAQKLTLVQAITAMMSYLTAADVSDRQTRGVLQWRAKLAVVEQAQQGMRPAQVLEHIIASSTHRDWRAACSQIAAVLRADISRAKQIAAVAAAKADQAGRQAAEAAAAARQEAALSAAAARNGDDKAATQHAAQARAYADAAAEHQQAAARYRALEEAAGLWYTAATAAQITGLTLVRTEDSYSVPVGQEQAAAGGIREVAGNRRHHGQGAAA